MVKSCAQRPLSKGQVWHSNPGLSGFNTTGGEDSTYGGLQASDVRECGIYPVGNMGWDENKGLWEEGMLRLVF